MDSIKVKSYIRQKGAVTLSQLSTDLSLQESFLNVLLSTWARHGKIRVVESCDACSIKCSATATYQWIDKDVCSVSTI